MMGAGKTSVGTALARQLGVPFLDQDDEIEKAAQSTIAELFSDYGEAFFRDKESLVLARLLHGPPCVLSTGGGAFLAPDNRAAIAASGVAVWLRADLPLLWSRVRQKATRPLLQTEAPFETLAALFDRRNPVYALAPIHVATRAGDTVEDTARAVNAALVERSDAFGRTAHGRA